MTWWLPRWLLLVLAMLVGLGLGRWVGAVVGQAAWGAALGAMVMLALALLRDALHAARLLRWLRGDMKQQAPRDGGFWAELAYRIERALNQRDAALQQEQGRLGDFLQAIQASPNGITLLADGAHIVWCNDTAALQLGLDPQRDQGQYLTNLVRAPVFVGYWQSGDWRDAITMAGPGGDSMLQLQLRAYGDGQTLLVSQDVTAGLQADAMRRDFVANVSHEIRTPLTVLAGFIETMQSLPLADSERAHMLGLMQQQAGRMQVLVADLLTLAQLEGSPRPDTTHWLALAPLLRRVCADAEQLSRARQTVTLSPGPDLQVAMVDSELISAIGNLMSNAVRYTPDRGHVQLSWQGQADGSLLIEVKDDGPGIAREHLPRLTERFYRVDGSRSRETGGTGLGLAIVKHVAQRHGGDLLIDSSLGRGSRFGFVLPAVRVKALRPAD